MRIQLRDIADKYTDYCIETRRRFHRCPEEAFQEHETCAMICEELTGLGLTPRVIAGTGVIVDLGDYARSKKRVAIRADIDALRVREETGAAYASQREGYMHACGHDAHIAMNLTCARILKEMEGGLRGGVRLLFQPAEEIARGASRMIQEGALEGVDTIYGTHVWSDIPAGRFSAESGPRMASADFFTLTVKGRASHGSLPHRGIDAVAASAAVIQNVQVALHREVPATEPCVISFCQIHGGNTDNALPEQVTIGGTTRAFAEEVRQRFPELIRRAAGETAAAFGAKAELDYRWGTSSVTNDAACAARARQAITANYGEEALYSFAPIMSGEDFAEYQRRIPGVFVFLGVRNEAIGANHPQHSCRYAVDEKVLIRGAAAAAQYAADYLESAAGLK